MYKIKIPYSISNWIAFVMQTLIIFIFIKIYIIKKPKKYCFYTFIQNYLLIINALAWNAYITRFWYIIKMFI